MAGTRAQAELLRRSEWDARYQSALYAWQAAGGDTIVSFVPEKTIEKVNLGFVADRSGAVFTELLDSVLAEDDPAEAGTVVEAKDGAVAEYGGEDAPEDPPEKCPDCGQMTVVPKSSGIACTDPKCGYWFCA